MTGPLSLYGLFSDLIYKYCNTSSSMVKLILEVLLPAGLESINVDGYDIIEPYRLDPNRIYKFRKFGGVRINKNIIDEYRKSSAIEHCIKRFSSFLPSDLKKLFELRDDVYSIMPIDTFSVLGRKYLDYLKNHICNDEDESRKQAIKLISLCYIYCVVEQEPISWSDEYQKIEETTKHCAIINAPIFNKRHFIGREEIVSDIQAAFNKGNRVNLYGTSGCGKTQIALKIASLFEEKQYVVVWCNASSESTLLQSYTSFLHSVGRGEEKMSAYRIVLLVKNWCKEVKNWLFIFDNYISYSFGNTLNFEALIPDGNDGRILSTSLKYEDSLETENIKISAFTDEESAKFLNTLLRRPISSEDCSLLSLRMANHPLALAQAVAYINKNKDLNIEQYIALLNEQGLSFHRKSGISSHEEAVYSSLFLSLKLIGEHYGTIGDYAFFFMFVLSFFPDFGITGLLLNRCFYRPYVFSGDNYDLIDGYISPYFYSKAGPLAIDANAKRIFDKVLLPLYDKKEFYEIIELLSDFALCEAIHEEGFCPYYYFNDISYVRSHALVLEIIRERVVTQKEFEDLLDTTLYTVITFLDLASNANKCLSNYGEILNLTPIYYMTVKRLKKYRDKFNDNTRFLFRRCLLFTSTLIQITTNHYIQDYTNKYIVPEQKWIWNYIIDNTLQFENEAFLYIRKLEYCALFAPNYYHDSINALKDALLFWYGNIADSDWEELVGLFAYNKAAEFRDFIYDVLNQLYENSTNVSRIQAPSFGIVCVLDDFTISEIKKAFAAAGMKYDNINFVDNSDNFLFFSCPDNYYPNYFTY
ncbi:ATP-binding protein [uncultured Ruminococcus sp.]|uniref:ATP-binding protein n=1 Tax=uncultured Ruminococcus sp. TaxID=165186 RepID=UPI0025E4A6D9|nr:ATP-binding protein [uncultured Ruminococcus sp.]